MGACLGATNDPKGGKIGNLTKSMEILIILINRILNKKFRRTGGFRWSSAAALGEGVGGLGEA